MERDPVLHHLALVSGGHPRSLEYIVAECNACNDVVKTGISVVVERAAASICAAYNDVSNWRRLFELVFLAKEVKKDALLGTESMISLVARGILTDSFDEESDRFIPTIPELFLRK